jgi:hypothetical protein
MVGRQDSLAMIGNLPEGRKAWLNTLHFQDWGFSNRLVTCSSRKELLIILKDASCLRRDRLASSIRTDDQDKIFLEIHYVSFYNEYHYSWNVCHWIKFVKLTFVVNVYHIYRTTVLYEYHICVKLTALWLLRPHSMHFMKKCDDFFVHLSILFSIEVQTDL